MKDRKHHNNKGYRKIKRGKTRREVICMAVRVFGKNNIKVKGDEIYVTQ
jgi:hypothetical protein